MGISRLTTTAVTQVYTHSMRAAVCFRAYRDCTRWRHNKLSTCVYSAIDFSPRKAASQKKWFAAQTLRTGVFLLDRGPSYVGKNQKSSPISNSITTCFYRTSSGGQISSWNFVTPFLLLLRPVSTLQPSLLGVLTLSATTNGCHLSCPTSSPSAIYGAARPSSTCRLPNLNRTVRTSMAADRIC